MILDERLEFADALSVAATAGTTVVGDVIDLGANPYDVGLGEDMWLIIRVTTGIVAAGAGSIRFYLVSDALATLGSATAANCTIHYDTGALTTASGSPAAGQTAGSTLVAIKLPSGTYERYLGVLCTIATQTVSAGAVDAFLTKDFAKWAPMADATN